MKMLFCLDLTHVTPPFLECFCLVKMDLLSPELVWDVFKLVLCELEMYHRILYVVG